VELHDPVADAFRDHILCRVGLDDPRVRGVLPEQRESEREEASRGDEVPAFLWSTHL
jgi:hypothetical protein